LENTLYFNEFLKKLSVTEAATKATTKATTRAVASRPGLLMTMVMTATAFLIYKKIVEFKKKKKDIEDRKRILRRDGREDKIEILQNELSNIRRNEENAIEKLEREAEKWRNAYAEASEAKKERMKEERDIARAKANRLKDLN